jgi:CHASE2 domain-containing sensor protein
MPKFWLGQTAKIERLGFGISVAVTAVILALVRLAPAVLVRLEDASFDFRFKLRGERLPGDEIIMVAIDEKSLREIGRWPWSRSRQAALVERIAADQPKVIGLDIIYYRSSMPPPPRSRRAPCWGMPCWPSTSSSPRASGWTWSRPCSRSR